MKKKILYIITKSNFGGAQRYVFDLATSLPENEFEPIVALGGSGESKAKPGLLYNKLEESGIRTILVKNFMRDISFFKEPLVFFELYKIIKREKPDVVHLNSSKAGGVGALACRLVTLFSFLGARTDRLEPKIIFTAHGWAFKESRKNYQRLIIYFLSWFTVYLSHKTIVVSEDDLVRAPKFLTSNRLILIHNGISPITYRDRDDARKIIFGEAIISERNLAIGTIAELHPNKGLRYALEAISEIKKQKAENDHPIIFGIIGEGEQRQKLENEVKKLALQNFVFFTGYKNNAGELLSAFDIFLLPSLKEGLPYTILEAGSVGLPVVATNVGGAKDVIVDMETGILIRPAAIKEISYALRFFEQNPDRILEFGGKLKRRISEEFSLKKMLERTQEIYKQ